MEVSDKLFEDQRVDVLPKLVEQEPVPDPEPVADGLDLGYRSKSRPGPQQHLSHLGAEENESTVHNLDPGDQCYDDEPEP